MGVQRDLVNSKREHILQVVHANRGKRAYLFGSAARGEDSASSDVDLLIELEEGSSLFDVMHMEDQLRALLGVSVDIVSAGGLLPRDEHIRREAVPI